MQLTLSRHTPCTIYGATATLRHYMNTSAQRRLLNSTLPPGVCAPNSAFVTLIANETYVSAALCLKKSMARVRSACPMILVVADPLPADAMAALEATAITADGASSHSHYGDPDKGCRVDEDTVLAGTGRVCAPRISSSREWRRRRRGRAR